MKPSIRKIHVYFVKMVKNVKFKVLPIASHTLFPFFWQLADTLPEKFDRFISYPRINPFSLTSSYLQKCWSIHTTANDPEMVTTSICGTGTVFQKLYRSTDLNLYGSTGTKFVPVTFTVSVQSRRTVPEKTVPGNWSPSLQCPTFRVISIAVATNRNGWLSDPKCFCSSPCVKTFSVVGEVLHFSCQNHHFGIFMLWAHHKLQRAFDAIQKSFPSNGNRESRFLTRKYVVMCVDK